MDTFTFASLAHVQILLLPVGATPQAVFEKHASEIRSFETIRLGDIPADTKSDRAARFMPSPLSTGHLHISFPSHPPPPLHASLSLLRPSHFPLAVIGVASCTQSDSLPSLLSQFNAAMLDIFPESSIFPLAKHCFVFEEGEGNTNLNLAEDLPGLVVLPSMMGNKKLYISTLLADLCSQILGQFGVLVQALESPLGNEYLNSSLMPTLPPLSDIPSPLNPSSSKGDSVTLPSHSSQPEMSRLTFSLAAAPSMKRNSSSGPAFCQASLAVQVPKKRISTIGTSSPLARFYKALGDFFLLAGRTEDALIWYTEALQIFRTSQDPIWYASTLEGLATLAIVDAWSAGHGLHNSSAAVKDPWAHISDKLSQATSLYHKANTPDVEQVHSLLVYLYCSCVLRHSSLLFSIWSAKGWGPLAFTSMLHPGSRPYIPPTLIYDESSDWRSLERLTHTSRIPRSSIAGVLAQLHGPWLLHLGSRERLTILEAVASTYACIGYKRKEAYVLREVLGCLLDLMVCGREEDSTSQSAGVPSSAGLGIHNVTPTPGSTWGGAVGVRLSESAQGNSAVLALLKHICKVLGICLDAVQLLKSPEDAEPALMPYSVSIRQYDEEEMEILREPFGWPELQIGVVREAVAVAEALPDFPAVAQFALSSIKTLQDVLTPGDQHHLYSTSTRALTIASRRGDTRSVDYWSGRPIVSIALAPLPAIRLPVEKALSILHAKTGATPLLLQGGNDPFLYNPRRAAAGKGMSLIVENETIDFIVTLQNPYIFDLELQHLSLSVSGVDFNSQPISVVIPASSFHQVVLSGKAIHTGILCIRGCFVQAPGGIMREYTLPLYTEQEDERISRKRRSLACEVGRYKQSGLDCFPWSKSRRQSERAAENHTSFRFLECKIVPEQPLLRIRRTTITHGALMLYDGERSTIRITIENISSNPVDFLRVGYEDSTIAPAQFALAEGNLSVFDTYETEHSLINTPVFSWEPDAAKVIAPNQNLTLTVNCLGKVGCTSGTLHISYSHVHRPKPDENDLFYVRQISYPLAVTVYHMLECHGMDIVPFPSYANGNDFPRSGKGRDLITQDKSGWCLFSIEVRNTYGLPFDVTFSRVQDGEFVASSVATIPPGSMSRIVLPVKKVVLSEGTVSNPIPTLSDRQFVITKSHLSDLETKAQRELFWYREELFKCVRGRWQETGGVRSGELLLRDQRMTLPMLETFRLEAAGVQMSLTSSGPLAGPILQKGERYHPQPNIFISLRTQVKNLSATPLVFTMDLELDPTDCVVYEGVLNDIPIGRLNGGESQEHSIGLCFLASGRFEISAQVRPFGTMQMDTRLARAQLTAVVYD